MRYPVAFGLLFLLTHSLAAQDVSPQRPNIILVMADDMGWAQTGYRQHPVLKTPHLDAMAAAGLRFDRFYAGAPNCSPTRATVMTGRSNDRTGVENHGFGLQPHEKTIAQALAGADYRTAHFGKWHLSGLRGPGAPILAADPLSPGRFGFDEWLSVTNFFDRDPLLSRRGKFESFRGDSSEIIVEQALKFIRQQADDNQPFFTVIWFGSPHSPWRATEDDRASFAPELDLASQHHHGELVAMDRSIGTLRSELRKLQIAEDTLLWFCSDNGGLPRIEPSSVGPLRGFKNSVYEGGLRVPAIIEWPSKIRQARITNYPAGTVDIFPTLVDLLGLSEDVLGQPHDGISLRPLMESDLQERPRPLGFRHTGRAAWIDNRYKLVCTDLKEGDFELYDLETDVSEQHDLAAEQPERLQRMRDAFLQWNESVTASSRGADYGDVEFDPRVSQPQNWNKVPDYQPYLSDWSQRVEYRDWLKRQN